jgi:predicted S18 family serine protease
MTRVWKFLAIIFFTLTVVFAVALISDYRQSLLPSDLKLLQERINSLEEENALLTQNLYHMNLSLEYYKKQANMYRERLWELGAEGNITANYTISGSAELDAVAVRQKVEVVGEFPFYQKRVTYEGTIMRISVEIRPGKGRVLVVTTPRMGLIFQDAANTAVDVAQRHANKDLRASDVIFSIVTEEEISAVDGPSAGALMTLLVISAIEGKSLPEDMTITGTIDQDGKIGEIGGIIEKAQAAKDNGKRLLLIPRENSQLIQWIEERKELAPGFVIIERRPTIIDAEEYIEENVGIDVEYVESIDDILAYV